MLALDIAGITISVFFIFFVVSKKNSKTQADWLLVSINVIIIGILIVDGLLQYGLTTWILLLLHLLPLYLLPLFIVYALEIIQETNYRNLRWVLLFSPTILASVYMAADLFFWGSYTHDGLIALYNNPTLPYHLITKVLPFIYVGALIFVMQKLMAYDDKIKDNFSFIDPIKLNWLKASCWIYIIVTSLSILGFLISQFQILPIDSHFVCNMIGILLFLSIFYVSFHGIRHYTIGEYYGNKALASAVSLSHEETKLVAINEPTRVPTIPSPEQKKTYQNLVIFFETKHPYLEPKLLLSDVADTLGVPSHVLSQTINVQAKKPFYDFVNEYRVKHFRKLLTDPAQKKFTILALGLESGFNSKASLNRVFREETGLTPSEYQKRHLAI